MRDELPDNLLNGSGVLNLDDSTGPGTHWTAWYGVVYFDSYGLPPPEEFLDKTRGREVEYNDLNIQRIHDPPFCGHLCLAFLEAMYDGEDPTKFALKLYRLQ